MPNVFSMSQQKTQPPDVICHECKEPVVAEWCGEYGWMYRCDECEIAWEA